MSTKDPKEKCSFNCWMIGGGVGVLGFLLMWLAGGYGVLSSLFWGIVLGALIGWLLNYLLCGKISAAGTAGVAGAAGAAATMASRDDSGAGSYGAAQSAATSAEARDDSGAGSFGADQADAAAQATQEAMREDSGAGSFDDAADAAADAAESVREDSGAGSFASSDDASAADAEKRDDSVASFGADQTDATKASDAVKADAADAAESAREDSGAASFAGAAAATAATKATSKSKSTDSSDTTAKAKNAGGSAKKPAAKKPAAKSTKPKSTKSTTSKAKAAPKATKAADLGEDYDGDGILEGVNEGKRPEALKGPRAGGADNLKEIKGVGPKLEGLLHSLGFYHFDQVANWTADEVAWVDANLKGFRGRVSRDNWVEQAKILASGAETEFSKKVQKGKVY